MEREHATLPQVREKAPFRKTSREDSFYIHMTTRAKTACFDLRLAVTFLTYMLFDVRVQHVHGNWSRWAPPSALLFKKAHVRPPPLQVWPTVSPAPLPQIQSS